MTFRDPNLPAELQTFRLSSISSNRQPVDLAFFVNHGIAKKSSLQRANLTFFFNFKPIYYTMLRSFEGQAAQIIAVFSLLE